MYKISEDFITSSDLYIAYRKAKVDMFYERDHVTAVEFCIYEEQLDANLNALLSLLHSAKPNWQEDVEFVGHYGYVPKSLDPISNVKCVNQTQGSVDTHFVTSDPDESWKYLAERKKHEAKFRIIGRHPIAFHVVSALWLQKVGHLYDGILQRCVYGSRLRRLHSQDGELGYPSRKSMGSFRPYTYGFREWRSNGLDAMRTALEQNRSVIAVTADLRRFYHEVSPEYLLHPEYLNQFGINLTSDQNHFTTQMITAFRTWAANTPEHMEEPTRGMPVGLSAPRVIANAILVSFDQFIQRELAPLYYGRYVDDVLLVLDNQRKMKSAKEVWKYIIERSNGLLESGNDDGEDAYWLNVPYSPNSRLRFVGDKQKVFSLEGKSGLALLETISRTISQRSSDWRLLPDLPGDTTELTNDFVIAGQDATEEVDNLRKSDGLSIRRLAFALHLRNLEAVQRDLKPDQWMQHRSKFFGLARDHILTVPGLFAYGPYLSRLVGLAVACRDWKEAATIVRRLVSLFDILSNTTSVNSEKLEICLNLTLEACLEAVIRAIGNDECDDYELESLLAEFSRETKFTRRDAANCRDLGHRLYAADLARVAFREQWLDGEVKHTSEMQNDWLVQLPQDVALTLLIPDVNAFLLENELCSGSEIPRAVAFPTRPLNPAEIVLLDQRCLFDSDRLRRWVRALRGVEIQVSIDGIDKIKRNEIYVSNQNMPLTPLVAVPCFETKETSWIASIAGTSEPDPDRYFRLNDLVNDVLKAKPTVNYLVLPELALPRRWFNRLANKLSHSGVSLIAGLEYLHFDRPSKRARSALSGTARGIVSNQVWASLATDTLGYRSHVIYVQEKERPAPEEEAYLRTIAGKLLAPKYPPQKPVIRHGSLHFGILICSELTNLELRRPFRGKIDVLFVPEWNKDTNTFAALVEASALDMHCFIVQVNNRSYGDCRIRAPYKDMFKRNVVRVMGGENDYFVIGRIDALGLRAFQSNFRSPSGGPYKPVPDGFNIDESRRVRPSIASD